MNITSSNNNTNANFKGITVMPAARKSIEKEISHFYGGSKSLEKFMKN